MSNYLFAQRDRFKHPLFRSQKFCRGYAWDWIVANAVWRDDGHSVEIKGQNVHLNRGQLSYSVRYMAEAWNWDKAAVSRFIARLKTEAMIETHTETGQIIVTVCNYDKYQSQQSYTETGTETGTETAPRQHRDSTETNKKKDKKDKKDNHDAREAKSDTNLADTIIDILGVDISKNQNWAYAPEIDTFAEQFGQDVVIEAAKKAAAGLNGKAPATPRYLKPICEQIVSDRQGGTRRSSADVKPVLHQWKFNDEPRSQAWDVDDFPLEHAARIYNQHKHFMAGTFGTPRSPVSLAPNGSVVAAIDDSFYKFADQKTYEAVFEKFGKEAPSIDPRSIEISKGAA